MMKHILLLITSFVLLQVHMFGQPRRFYIANDDHTDYMWTANEAVYKNVILSTLDRYLLQIDSSVLAGLPFQYQSKYNCDGSFWFWLYEKNRTEAEMKNLVAKVQSGHVSVPANPLAVLYGGLPFEASIRGMYYGGYLEKKYGIETRVAISMENQTLPLGLSSLWAGCGIKYSWKGVCGCASKLPKTALQARDNEVYYFKGLDGQKVLMKWYSLAQNSSSCKGDVNQSLGGYAEARCLSQDLISRMEQKSRSTNHRVIGAFGYGWDDLQSYTDGFMDLAKTASDSSNQVIVSNELDYFKDMKASYGAGLPEETVARGNEWDIYIASLAEVSARVKRSTERLRLAEAMATIVSLNNPGFSNGLSGMRDSAWMSVGLYAEHDWTADGPVSKHEREMFQRRMEHDFTMYVDTLYDLALMNFKRQISTSGNNQRFFVFNSLNWARTDFADLIYEGEEAIAVYDLTTNREVLHQFIKKNDKPYLRILSEAIPPVGYKVFEIRKHVSAKKREAAVLIGNVFENNQFRLLLTKGGVVTSLIDKINGSQELVHRSPTGRYFNDMGFGQNDSGDSLVIENAGPVSVTIKAVRRNGLRHTSKFTLYDPSIKRIDIENTISDNFSAVLSNTFSFNFSKPEVWHEEVGAVIKAKLQSSGGHYSERNARYDWLTLNHFASVGKGKYHVSIANRDCFFFNLGQSTYDSLDGNASFINVLVGGQTDGERLGIVSQGGDSNFVQQFSVSVQTNGLDKVQSMKSSLEFQQNLVASMIVEADSAVLPPNTYSLFETTNNSLVLWAMKPAEEGYGNNGIITRFWNLSESPAKASLKFNKNVFEAHETTHVEVNIKPIDFSEKKIFIYCNQQQMKTFRVRLK